MNAVASQETGSHPELSPVSDRTAGRLPAPFDPGIAHPARVYAFWLGGKDHYPADREVAREVVRLRPEVLAGVRANRAFGRRVIQHAACGAGIRQFLDIGAGLPAPGPTHQVAQQVSPACRTVYADNDPLVAAHCQALLAAAPGAAPCACIDADLRDPGALIASASEVLDFTRPIAVLILAVLHFLPDTDDPVARLAAALAPGSLIAISHVTADYAPHAIAEGAAAYNARVPLSVYPRSREQIAAILGNLPVQHPGIVPVSQWQPSLRDTPHPSPVDIHGAVARLPLTTPRPSAPASEAPAQGLSPDGALVSHPDLATEAAELAARAAQFPGHDITCEISQDVPHYVARARDLSAHPSLVMTSDPGSLFAALAGSSQPAAS